MQTRKCGDCNLCCKIPHILKPKNFKTKMYTWCQHCEIGVGCKIYKDRPDACKNFICGWLKGLVPIEWKPNKVGFYVTFETKEQLRDKVFVIYAETHRVYNIYKHLKEHDFFNDDGSLWKYVIRYNENENDLAVFDKARFGNKLKFCKRGEL